jgi:hypothetical protein
MKSLLIYAIVSTSLFFSAMFYYSYNTPHQTAIKAHTTQLETYIYIITKIDSSGYYGQSVNDNTGIYFTEKNVKGISLNVNDHVRVSFPLNSYEKITNIEKIN